MRNGMFFAAAAYILWGLFPVYFKLLKDIPPQQILMHRVLWSFLLLMGILGVRKQWRWLADIAKRPIVIAGFAASALLLSANWFLYIWAVNSGRVIDASLGYFMNPLVNVLLGYLLLGERLRAWQWCAVALAACGVLWLTWQSGHPPWIGLALAVSFGLYGLLRKTAALGALEGLALETMMLFPAALGYLIWLTLQQHNAFVAAPSSLQWLLIAAGPITAIPLLMFAIGARRIPMATLGLLQYMSPSLQLILGVWLYNEPFDHARMIGFIAIWAGLVVYSGDGIWRAWHGRTTALASNGS
jgi:chloramphenicol-sensitive protein RarD